jgi:hypothetical protein
MLRVDLVAMAVPLVDHGLSVRPLAESPRNRVAWLSAEAHRPAHVGDVLLFREQIDHGMRRGGVELAGVGSLQPADVAGELDHRALQAEADPEEGHAALAGEPDRLDLPLDPPDAEPPGDQDPVRAG